MTCAAPNLALSSQSVAFRVTEELRLTAGRLHRAEQALEELLARDAPELHHDTARDLQEIDVAAQTLQALCTYLEAAIPQMSATDHVDTRLCIAGLGLRAVAQRLSGQSEPGTETSDQMLF